MAHAAGELGRRPVHKRLQAGDAEQFGLIFLKNGGRDFPEVAEKFDIFLDTEIVVEIQTQSLGHKADAGFDGLRVGDHVLSRHRGGAAVGAQDPGQYLHEAGFTGAVRPQQPENLTGPDGKGNSPERRGDPYILAKSWTAMMGGGSVTGDAAMARRPSSATGLPRACRV